MTTLYGIKNCDTVKKARRWLEQNGIEYRFHDLRDDGLDANLLTQWIKQTGWECLLNQRSTTWKGLAVNIRDSITAGSICDEKIVALLLANPTLIKRPVLVCNKRVARIGFKENDYREHFA